MKLLSKLKDFLKSKKFKELENENIELERKLAIVTATMEYHERREREWTILALELRAKCNKLEKCNNLENFNF